MKILVVDDDEIARLSLCGILGTGGTEVVEACDGEEAWALLDAGLRPAACCCDVMMPRLDGLGLLRRTRAHPVLDTLPFILISAAADSQTLEAAVAHRVDGYLLKPFLATQSRDTVERVLRERRLGQAEHFLVSRRRLGIPLDRLAQMLDSLRLEIRACIDASGAPLQALRDVPLDRLHAECQALGLWKCALLLKKLAGAGASMPETARLMLQEVERLVQDQRAEIADLTPAAAPA